MLCRSRSLSIFNCPFKFSRADLHDIQAHAPAGYLGDFVGGAEAGRENQLQRFRFV